MKQIASKIWHSPSARNVGKLLSANVIAQAIGLLVYPLLTRLYSPEDFGLLNLFVSIGGGLVILSTLEWYNAIVLPPKNEDAAAIVHVSFSSLIILTLLLTLTIPFAAPIANLFNSPQLATYYWLLPVYVFLVALWNILNYWYIRTERYTRISGYQMSQSLFSAGYKSGFGFIPVSGGLIYATVASLLCSSALSLFLAGKKVLGNLFRIDTARLKEVVSTYANFPKYSTPRALLNYIVGQLPVLLLTPVFGSRYVGFWGMALLLAFVPISTISRALYQVFFRNTTEFVNNKRLLSPYYRHFTFGILGVTLPAFAILCVFLPQLTTWLLGAEWHTTGEYIRWMLPWLASSLLCGTTAFLADVFFKQKTGLFFEILMALARGAGVGLGILSDSFEVAIIGYSLGSAVVCVAQYIWHLSLVRKYDMSLPKAD